jgi:formate-dependent nitrite reductase cytochrome c552 subunit
VRRIRNFAAAAVLLALGCNPSVQPERFAPPPGPPVHDVVINEPAKLSSVPVEGATAGVENAQDMRLACKTCHSLRESDSLPLEPGELEEFHQGLVFAHGPIQCASCHQPGEFDRLRLADGSTLPLVEVMTLCGQCHGPQARDYARGAHGGMQGYWDLSRGPRTRNNCVDCHDPHAPQFAGGHPVFPPRDRLLGGSAGTSANEGAGDE